MSSRASQIQRRASELGYRHIWTGALHPPSGVAFWPDDDFEAFLVWGRTALDVEILYIDDFQITDVNSENLQEITMCFFMAHGICHTWASEGKLRNLRGDVAELMEEFEDESGDNDEMDYDEIHLQLLEYLEQVASSEEFVKSLSDPKFYRQRGGPPTSYVTRLFSEFTNSLGSQNISYYHFAGIISENLGEVMTHHREAIDKMLLSRRDDVRDEISESDEGWTERLTAMRVKTVKEYLTKKYGFASPAIVSEIARNK